MSIARVGAVAGGVPSIALTPRPRPFGGGARGPRRPASAHAALRELRPPLCWSMRAAHARLVGHEVHRHVLRVEPGLANEDSIAPAWAREPFTHRYQQRDVRWASSRARRGAPAAMSNPISLARAAAAISAMSQRSCRDYLGVSIQTGRAPRRSHTAHPDLMSAGRAVATLPAGRARRDPAGSPGSRAGTASGGSRRLGRSAPRARASSPRSRRRRSRRGRA
jgi:hypothetical protein